MVVRNMSYSRLDN